MSANANPSSSSQYMGKEKPVKQEGSGSIGFNLHHFASVYFRVLRAYLGVQVFFQISTSIYQGLMKHLKRNTDKQDFEKQAASRHVGHRVSFSLTWILFLLGRF